MSIEQDWILTQPNHVCTQFKDYFFKDFFSLNKPDQESLISVLFFKKSC